MKKIPLIERAGYYIGEYPKIPDAWPIVRTGRWLTQTIIIGSNYSDPNPKKFYGAYPRGYLEKMLAYFPDRTRHKNRTLHMFSGSLPKSEDNDYLRLDIKQDADHNSPADKTPFKDNQFDLILADPPYRHQDAEKYGTPYPNKRKVIRECHRILEPGGFLIWLDIRCPIWRKDMWDHNGIITIIRSTNNILRAAFWFRRRYADGT